MVCWTISCYTKVIVKNQINTYNKCYVSGYRNNFMLTCDFLFYYFLWHMGRWECRDNVELDQDKYCFGFWSRRFWEGEGWKWALFPLPPNPLCLFLLVKWTLMSMGVCVPVRPCVPWCVAMMWTANAQSWTPALDESLKPGFI